jgi:hypothetical protein
MAIDVKALGRLELVDPGGNPHRLGDMWADRPAVLLFLRHFG